MRILLNDMDSHNNFPNLALMKISAHHKQRGDSVELRKGLLTFYPIEEYDLCYASCIFRQNEETANNWAVQMPFPVLLGGSGVSSDVLADEIEHIKPDYSLYDIDYSIGFTSRGCIRKCGFCVVHWKEGTIRDNAPISEFWDQNHSKIKLLDNNILASPKCLDTFKDIIYNDLKVNITSGLDARLMNETFADYLAEMKPHSSNFKGVRVTFACDSISMMKPVKHAIELMIDAGISKHHISAFVLVGYDTTLSEDLQRIYFLADLGVSPFVMRYNMTKGKHDVLRHLARYSNRYGWRKYSFQDYLEKYAPEVLPTILLDQLPFRQLE